ncbi:MAG: AMP-binding protein, partial [Clostridia bacterium]|nr:AMP-binding protein [Clostridia bacterium]
MPKFKAFDKKSKYIYKEVPDFKTVREMIEYGHIKGGDNKQYVYLETRTKERVKSFNEVWHDTVGLGQYLFKNGLEGKKVAILSENSYYWIACFYALMTGRYVTIPLDAKLTDADLVGIMVKSKCDAIFYSDDFAGTIEKMKADENVKITNYIKISDFYSLIEEGHEDLKNGNKSYLEN